MGEIFDYVTSCFGMFDNLVIFFSDRKDKKNQKFTVKVFSFRPNHRKFKRLSKIVLEKDSRDIDLNEIPMPDSLELVSDCVRLVMLKTYLPTIGLAQTDRLGMHHSIECRAPFANYEIVQMILRDRGSLFSNGVRKARMKSVFKTMFTPDQLRSKKNGFQIPIKSWIAEIINSKEINLHNSSIFEAGLISEKGLKILTQPLNHLGRIKTGWYELLVFELWFRNLKDCLSKREKL
jgi:asparagine synthetase B (glutamine-hydrolysing)